MDPLENMEPYNSEVWCRFMRSFDPGVTFHDYASAFRDSGPYRVAPQVKNIIESYTLELDCAVFAVRDGAVFGWWLDDRHAYLALELPGAAGGPNGDIEIISLARPAFSEVAAPTPSPPLEVKLARLLDKIADLSSSTPSRVGADEHEHRSKTAYSFILRSGRRVWLNAFHLDQLYAGLIAGLPQSSPAYIFDQKTKAHAIWGPRPTYTIAPASITREHRGRRYESLPWYCYKAWLMSDEPDSLNPGSELIVIWFAESPMKHRLITTVAQACRDVPWERHAKARDF